MDNNYVAPVDHGVLSTTGSVAIGSAAQGVKAAANTWGVTTVTTAVIGGALGALVIGGIAALTPIGFVGVAILGGLGALGGAAAGGITGGTTIAPFLAAIGGAFGLAKGGVDAFDQVKAEKGAANVMQAQVAAYKAQAQAQAYAAANDNKYNFPAHGSAMNPALASIQADSAQAMGSVAAQGLQRA